MPLQPVNVDVAPVLLTYLDRLLNAGAIHFDEHGTPSLDDNVKQDLQNIHENLADGDNDLKKRLNEDLYNVIKETAELLPNYPDVLIP